MKRVWEALLLFALLAVAINIIIASVTPFLPAVGLLVLGGIGVVVGRYFYKRRLW